MQKVTVPVLPSRPQHLRVAVAGMVVFCLFCLFFTTSAAAQSRGEGVGALFSNVNGDTTTSITNGKTAPWAEVIVENATAEVQAVAKLNEKGLINFTSSIKSEDLGSIYIYAVDEAGATSKVLITGTSLNNEVLPPTLISAEEEGLPQDSIKLTGYSFPSAQISIRLTSDQDYDRTLTTTTNKTTGLWELLVDTLEGGSYTARAVSTVGGQQSQTSQELFFEIEAVGIIDNIIETVINLLGPIATAISSFAQAIIEAVQALPEPIKRIADTTSKAIIPVTLLGLLLQAGLFTAKDLALLFSQYLLSLGKLSFLPIFVKIRKGGKPWGTLYDAFTKQPLAHGLVRLLDKTGKLIDMEITNKLGIFTFLPQEGSYKLEASKAGYTFPSKIVSGKRDGEYENIYKGEVFEVSEAQPTVIQSIPIDPHEPATLGLLARIFRKHGYTLNIALLTGGLILSAISYLTAPGVYNQAVAGFYIVTLPLISVSAVKTKRQWGTVKDETGGSVAGIALSLVNADSGKLIKRRITNERGQYQFTASSGKYKILIASVDWERVNQKRYYTGEEIIVSKKIELISSSIMVKKKPAEALKRRETV